MAPGAVARATMNKNESTETVEVVENQPQIEWTQQDMCFGLAGVCIIGIVILWIKNS